ncbi:MAG: transglutaminase domain-containing protein [Phycisphaerales bacterium]|nr:MAG: transglutaminase domain-containing protein [Phycisphaerales bacterium]
MKIICVFCVCLMLVAPAVVKAGAEKAPESEIEYFAVFMEGKKAGYARNERTVSDGKVTTVTEVNLTISRAGIPLTVNMTSESVETIDGEPISFKSIQDLGLMKMEVSGRMQPDGKVALVNSSVGSVQKSVIDWPEGALMAEGLRLLQESKGLKEGTEYSYTIFEPSMATALRARTVVGTTKPVDLLGRVVNLTEITSILSMPPMGEISTKSYVDEDFKLQKDIMPIMNINIEMVACAKEFALGKNDVVELIGKMFVDSPVPLKNLKSIESITYHMAPLADAKMTIPPNDNQQVRKAADGKVVLTVKPVAAAAGVKFPYKGNDRAALEALEPTQFVQSDHEKIVELARQAIGKTEDAAEAVDKIEAFVADYVEDKNLSVGYASAVEVAQSKQGDCTEHAVLTAAMCRAIGIPAQVVTGLAYVTEWRSLKSGFGGHAWTQAYIGGKWIGLDAAFRGTGRGGYDAGHIALAAGNGDPGDFFSLVTTMGQFEFEKVEVKRK